MTPAEIRALAERAGAVVLETRHDPPGTGFLFSGEKTARLVAIVRAEAMEEEREANINAVAQVILVQDTVRGGIVVEQCVDAIRARASGPVPSESD